MSDEAKIPDEAETNPADPAVTIADIEESAGAADLTEIQEAAQAIAVRLLVLDQQVGRAKRNFNDACAVAYPVFARLRNADIPQVAPDLGQGRAGLFSLLAGARTTVVDEDELLLLYAVNSPSDLEDYVTPSAFEDERVIKLLAGHFPEYVARRIKRSVRAEVDKQIDKRDGWISHPGTGELVQVAKVTPHPANGRFQLRPDPRVQQMITAAIDAGRITEDGVITTPESETR